MALYHDLLDDTQVSRTLSLRGREREGRNRFPQMNEVKED